MANSQRLRSIDFVMTYKRISEAKMIIVMLLDFDHSIDSIRQTHGINCMIFFTIDIIRTLEH